MKETIKLQYVKKDDKIEVSSNVDIKDNISFESLKEDELIIENIDNHYYLSPSRGFEEDNLYHIKLLNDNISFITTNKKELLVKIKPKKARLPKYWQEYLDKKIPLVKEKIKNNDFNFILFSDVHINTNRMKTPLIIKYLNDKLDIDEIIFNGDIITSYDTLLKAYDELIKWKEAYKGINYLLVYGNHDSNAKDYSKDENVVTLNNFKYLAINNKKLKYEREKMYATYDLDDKKIRIIVLDTGACKVSSVDNKELKYFKKKLSEKPDYQLLIFAHRIFEGTEIGEKHPNIVIHESGKKVKKVIDDNYKDNIIALISGHNHIDCIEKGCIYNNIARTCDGGDRNSLFDANYPYRTRGTTEEQALDIVSINKKERSIEFIRIGVGDTDADLKLKY